MSWCAGSEGDSCCSAYSANIWTRYKDFVISQRDQEVSREMRDLLFRSFTWFLNLATTSAPVVSNPKSDMCIWKLFSWEGLDLAVMLKFLVLTPLK